MKVCTYGGDAIGGHLAARLAQGTAEDSVIARGPQLATLRAKGLTVRTPEGVLRARPAASADRDHLRQPKTKIQRIRHGPPPARVNHNQAPRWNPRSIHLSGTTL
jgi:hypothetical protein